MSSLSLPKVLSQRKPNNPETERENFQRAQNVSLTKAINVQESPVKEKHVRSVIIGTFQEKGCRTFWNIVLSMPLQGHPIICWKFLHILHKVLREGHSSALEESYRHRKTLVELGKLWGHLKDGYGKLIRCYCNLLVYKLEFHRRNPQFPLNLQITNKQLEDIGEHDANVYFQLSCEMFDYTEEILALQASIFGCLDMSRANSMTNSGQCRLASLISCIQDSSHLYDYTVKILFKLHSLGLPPDMLQGHRDRFLKQFRQLQQFYISSSNLQYFKYLIQVPLLPENPPNLLISTDLSSHISPVVILHSPEPSEAGDTESVDMSLVDFSKSDVTENISSNSSTVEDEHGTQILSQELSQKEHMIQQLIQKLEMLRLEIQHVKIECERRVDDLKQQIGALELQRSDQQREIEMLQHELSEYKDKLDKTDSQDTLKLAEKAKLQEEKFQKMKDVYNKLREEHISLIRQKADLEKQSSSAKSKIQELETKDADLQEQLKSLQSERNIVVERLQQSSSAAADKLNLISEECDHFQSLNKQLLCDKAELQSRCDQFEKQLQQEVKENQLQDSKSSEDKTALKLAEETLKNDINQEMWELIICLLSEAESVIKAALKEYDNPVISKITCTPELLLQQVNSVNSSANSFENGIKLLEDDPQVLIKATSQFAHNISLCLFHGQATAQTCQNSDNRKELSDNSKALGEVALQVIKLIKGKEDTIDAFNVLNQAILKLMKVTECLLPNEDTEVTQKLGDQVIGELSEMNLSIEKALNSISAMMAKSKSEDSGVKLEVNEQILAACNALIENVKVLVLKSKYLQEEIVEQGRGSVSNMDFYNRNHRWTEGLISAAKVIAIAANFFIEVTDKVVSGEAKFDELILVSQEIAAATAQLVVASKVKAHRGSSCLASLSQASRSVTDATGNIVATCKSCAQLIEEHTDLDFSNLSLHQAKLLEMESQVRVLELESSLDKERLKLAELRKTHYHLAGASEGWDPAEHSS